MTTLPSCILLILPCYGVIVKARHLQFGGIFVGLLFMVTLAFHLGFALVATTMSFLPWSTLI